MATTSEHSAVVTLPSDTTIQITREFAAPRHLVWRVWTEPELIRQWWAGQRGTVTSVEVDFRVGGKWRYVMMANGGFEVAFHGEYREITVGDKLVSTDVFEGAPDAEAVNIATFTEHGGRTTLTLLVQHQNRQNRDMHVNSGMEGGLQESLDLAEQLARALS
jgi:uncharacterized protein YndB with AHSA1/START domain